MLYPSSFALPVSAYCDSAIFAAEKSQLFTQSPQFIGHASYVPNVGDYYALAHENEARVLIHQADGSLALLSNICRHRQAILLRGKGNLGLSNTLVCPLHQWTYNSKGQLLGAPSFEKNPCRHLTQYPLHTWNGLLFTGVHQPLQELADMLIAPELNFSAYVLNGIKQHHCPYNWKTFMEVYLEDYHVASSHPGLGKWVDCTQLNWQYGDHYSVQTVGLHPLFDQPNSSGTAIYQSFHEAILRHSSKKPKYGAIWMAYYPNIMIEWYPNVLVVSLLQAKNIHETLNTVAFFYPKDIVDFEPEFCEIQQAAYFETCLEDDDFAIRMDAGRKVLWEINDNDTGPYQSPLEDGMVHFHQWYRQHMKI